MKVIFIPDQKTLLCHAPNVNYFSCKWMVDMRIEGKTGGYVLGNLNGYVSLHRLCSSIASTFCSGTYKVHA